MYLPAIAKGVRNTLVFQVEFNLNWKKQPKMIEAIHCFHK